MQKGPCSTRSPAPAAYSHPTNGNASIAGPEKQSGFRHPLGFYLPEIRRYMRLLDGISRSQDGDSYERREVGGSRESAGRQVVRTPAFARQRRRVILSSRGEGEVGEMRL